MSGGVGLIGYYSRQLCTRLFLPGLLQRPRQVFWVFLFTVIFHAASLSGACDNLCIFVGIVLDYGRHFVRNPWFFSQMVLVRRIGLAVFYLLVLVIASPFWRTIIICVISQFEDNAIFPGCLRITQAIKYVPIHAVYHRPLASYTGAFRNSSNLDTFYEGYQALHELFAVMLEMMRLMKNSGICIEKCFTKSYEPDPRLRTLWTLSTGFTI
jgi:hypothetical protein